MDTNLFNAIFEQSAIAMVISRLDGRLLYMNDAFCRFTGYKKEELLNETYRKYTFHEDIEINEKYHQQLLKREIDYFQMEKRYHHKAGQVVWGLLSVSLIFDNEKKPSYLMAQIQDITEKKEIEMKLIDSEQSYRLITENSSDRIVVVNHEGKYKYISLAFTNQLGYTRDQLVGIGPLQIIHEQDKLLFSKALQSCLESNLTISVTYRIRHKDGYFLWTEASLKCICQSNGSKDVVFVCRDITERKKIEKKLNEANDRIQIILESITDGFVALDHESRFIYINKAALQMMNKSRDRLLGYRCQDVIPQFLTRELIENYHIVKEQRVPVKLEFHCEELNSTFVVRMYPMKNIVSIYFLDITEQKKIEEWLRKTEKLSLVGQLAAGVAHEIRNPMTSIKGFMQLIKSTKEFKDMYIDIILSELERSEAIIYEFLNLAKPNETGVLERASISHILSKVIHFLEAQAVMNGVTIHLSFCEECFVQCNVNQLKQVFINIIQNAIEASLKNSNIYISVIENDKQEVIIKIEDEGCGISNESLEKLGEPFYSTKEKGTGLGLLVTYKIIEAHKGKLNFSSEEGRGTIVDIVLPKQIVSLVKHK